MDLATRLPPRSLIPACDVDLPRFKQIVHEIHDLPQVGAFKVGAALGLSVGLPAVVEAARAFTDKPLIYDHQKAGTDIPDTAAGFMRALRTAGLDAVILFPFTGPATQRTWTQAAVDEGLDVLVGAHMTHDGFLAADNGYIETSSTTRIYEMAAAAGVRHFVVPGNQPDVIKHVREVVSAETTDAVFYAPGFIAQRGQISEAALVAGSRWHAIVGRAIYEAADIRSAVASLSHSL
ncbi:MAG TPA: orotidine 5'-phosphate decarboxylase / HUMPS family protein [Acidimicrobiales bacterium]|nr:orotidine 5'-phosphate decarboxylase / HUMPS family protein [Acidimicrobiales bacterium]